MDFLHFFGLKEDPFKLTPDPAYFYPSSSHNEGLLLMDYSIDQREGFLLVIGDPGTGKTTMLNVFLEKWKSKAEIAIVLTPRLSPEEFLCAVAEDLHIDIASKNKNEIIKSLMNFMTQKTAEGKRIIIIVDEAQNLPEDTMEELRLLSNLETDKNKLLQIVLLGQPELEAKLASDKLRQLNQRISTRVQLRNFNDEETLDYINFRIIKAGKKNLQVNKRAANSAFRRTRGVPRLINMLMSRTLMAAYLDESNYILTRHIDHAVKSLNHNEIKGQPRPRFVPAMAGAAVLALVIVSLYFYLQDKNIGIAKLSDLAQGNRVLTVSPDEQNNEAVSVAAEDIDTWLKLKNVIPALKLAAVKVDVAFVRNRPDIESAKAGVSLRGNQLIVLSESFDRNSGTWYQIVFQGKKRWISGRVVNIIDVSASDTGLLVQPESAGSAERDEEVYRSDLDELTAGNREMHPQSMPVLNVQFHRDIVSAEGMLFRK